MSGASPIRVECPRDDVVLITIDREDSLNTLSVETLDALDDALDGLAGVTPRALVITGAGGKVFAAGADIREVAALAPRDALAFAMRGQRLLDRIEQFAAPVFAAIDGYCMGGGLDLALACDVRIASAHSVFAHPGARLGIVTGFGGTQRLPRLVGRSRALELFLTARRVSADEALRIGLVDALGTDAVAAAVDAAGSVRFAADVRDVKMLAIRAWRAGRSL